MAKANGKGKGNGKAKTKAPKKPAKPKNRIEDILEEEMAKAPECPKPLTGTERLGLVGIQEWRSAMMLPINKEIEQIDKGYNARMQQFLATMIKDRGVTEEQLQEFQLDIPTGEFLPKGAPKMEGDVEG